MSIEVLAQKLYNEDGGQGDLYETDGNKIRRYEQLAMEILGENHS